MAISEADRFQSTPAFGGNPEAEGMVNLQTAGEYQTPSEYIAPTTEAELETELEQEGEGDQLSETELETELFLNELRDSDFESMTAEMLQEVEANFEAYANQQGLVGERENMMNHPNF